MPTFSIGYAYGSFEGYGACDWSALRTHATCNFLWSLLSNQVIHELINFIAYWVGNVIYKIIIFKNLKWIFTFLGAGNFSLLLNKNFRIWEGKTRFSWRTDKILISVKQI